MAIDGTTVEFDVVRSQGSWIAQGWWNGYAVELIGDHLEPESVALQRARTVPAP